MALQHNTIHRVGNRHVLFLGCERELIMMAGVLAGALVFSAQEWMATFFGIGLWFFALIVLRLTAKSDPVMSKVYRNSLKYRGTTVIDPNTGKKISGYFPPRSTPYRDNTASQGARYK